LLDYVLKNDTAVYTDPDTARRGRFLYKNAGVSEKIISSEPREGELFFYNPKYTVLKIQSSLSDEKTERYLPKPSWNEVWRKEHERKILGVVIEKLGLKRFVPKEIYRRLNQPNPSVIIFRT
jgi:hypothetical protein